jgi:hypothetical protein
MDQSDKLERAIFRIKQKYDEYEKGRKDRSIMMTNKILESSKIDNKKTCRALTLSGKPCKFKAVYGNYCRKHTK